MMQRFRAVIILAIIFAALCGGAFWYVRAQAAEPVAVHFHAGFAVYRNNERVDFSGSEFMHVSPCSDDETEHELSDDEEQIEKGHLHDGVGDVVHIHRKNARWKDLFKNINYEVGGDVVGYINGERVFDVLNKKIGAYDRALFLLGDATDISTKLDAVPNEDRVKEVEAAGRVANINVIPSSPALRSCEGGIPPLDEERIAAYLADVPAWTLHQVPMDGKPVQTLTRTVTLKDFRAVMAFLRKVEELAESEGHHPDFSVHYNKVVFTLFTHAIGGLHDNDFILAAKIDELLKAG